MAYELTVEYLVAEALLRDPSIGATQYRRGLKLATVDSDATRERYLTYLRTLDGEVNDYGRGYLAMAAVLAKAETLPEGTSDGV